MHFSRHNIFSRITGSDNWFIVNPLTGSADILSPDEAARLQLLMSTGEGDAGLVAELSEKGYVISPDEEKRLFRTKYLDFTDNREQDEVQLFFVPNYSCNFACTYCYQDEYENPNVGLSEPVIDAFFNHIRLAFANRKKYITVFGGEPLLESPRQKSLIGYLLGKARQAGIDVCVVTNGYSLESYMDILGEASIREIQVTLDGTAGVHNERRFLKGGGATFERIVGGIDACLASGFPVNLRMVIDKENIDDLQGLARFAIDRGWTANPLFKTQIGRNYELHHCQSAPDKLFSRIALYEAIFDQVKKHPHILEFYQPAYSIAKFLFENEILPDPLFDGCPACKTEWAFDFTGQIYPCTATVGKANESLGTFYPEVTILTDRVDEWENRDVTTIENCQTCNLQLACGGGCGSVAKNRTGSVCSTDCRPIKELLELGFGAYFAN